MWIAENRDMQVSLFISEDDRRILFRNLVIGTAFYQALATTLLLSSPCIAAPYGCALCPIDTKRHIDAQASHKLPEPWPTTSKPRRTMKCPEYGKLHDAHAPHHSLHWHTKHTPILSHTPLIIDAPHPVTHGQPIHHTQHVNTWWIKRKQQDIRHKITESDFTPTAPKNLGIRPSNMLLQSAWWKNEHTLSPYLLSPNNCFCISMKQRHKPTRSNDMTKTMEEKTTPPNLLRIPSCRQTQ